MSGDIDPRGICTLVRRALWEEWDPIGVNDGGDWPDDEYDSYAPAFARMLERGATADELFESLWALETEGMGLRGNAARTRAFAESLRRRVAPA